MNYGYHKPSHIFKVLCSLYCGLVIAEVNKYYRSSIKGYLHALIKLNYLHGFRNEKTKLLILYLLKGHVIPLTFNVNTKGGLEFKLPDFASYDIFYVTLISKQN